MTNIRLKTLTNIRLKTLMEAYDAYQKAPNNIGIWLYNEIHAEAGTNQIPMRQQGEIVFTFCEGCGMDYLTWPGKCQVSDCGSEDYRYLGTQQGVFWRNQKWPNGGFRFRSVRPKEK